MKKETFQLAEGIREKALRWAAAFPECCFLNFTGSDLKYSDHAPFPSVLAAGASATISTNTQDKPFEKLKDFYKQSETNIFGYLAYDLKNSIEELKSENPDNLNFPDLFFFSPIHLIYFKGNEIEIHSPNPELVYNEITSLHSNPESSVILNSSTSLKHRMPKSSYLEKVEKIKNHLLEGDIYELNLCMEFYAEKADLNPVEAFIKLSEISPAPYSVFLKNHHQYLISASPERFLKKQGSKLISQPIKGTAMRSSDDEEDEIIKNNLRNSEKERSENMMIVDLVRNDLAISSIPGTVKVDELFGVYSFPQVHQMISTISSTIKKDVNAVDAIRNAFPMGSMTGAPKIKAMELIEKYEESKRGLFSGAVGFISPEGDFDLNVVIRSLIYNAETRYLSFHTGSAITFDSDPEKEYEECLLKGKAIRKVLGMDQ